MKGFFVSLAALFATPAVCQQGYENNWPHTFPIDALECHCADGIQNTINSCLYLPGQRDIQQGGDFCYPTVRWSPHMEDVFTVEYCQSSGYANPKPVCKPIKLCEDTLTNNPDYFKLC